MIVFDILTMLLNVGNMCSEDIWVFCWHEGSGLNPDQVTPICVTVYESILHYFLFLFFLFFFFLFFFV